MWATDVVLSNCCFDSSSVKSDLFTLMFLDTGNSKAFTCGATKYSYIICFCVSPYMKDILDDIIGESFNKKFKKGANGFRYLLLGQEKVFRCNTLL